MRFRTVVLLSALAIAPVCAEHIKVSNEHQFVNSTLSVDGVGCGSGGLRSSGAGGSGGGGRGGRDSEGGWGQWGSGGELVEGASGEEGPAQGGKSHKSSSPSHSVPHIAAARQSRSRSP